MEPATVLTSLGRQDAHPRVPAWWMWVLAAAGICGLALAGILFAPPGGSVAAWWPAAGLSVWFVLLNPPRRRPAALALVFVTTALANLAFGRDLTVVIGFGIANTVEPAVIAVLLSLGARRFVLDTLLDGLRFLLSVAAGAIAMALIVGATVSLAQYDGTLVTTGLVAASHAAAVLLMAPFAVLPQRVAERFSWVEVAAHTATVGIAVAVVFQPGARLPLAFLPLTLMIWAAFRFPMAVTLAQSLTLGVAVLALTLVGGGQFAASDLTPIETSVVVDVYLTALATVTILLITARNDLRRALRSAATTTQLVTEGFVDTAIGLVIAEDDHGASVVTWTNGAGRRFLEKELDAAGHWSGEIERGARAALADGVETVYEQDGSTIRLVANRISGDGDRFAVQLVDVTSTVRAVQARLDAETERDAARTTRIDLERQREDFVATTSHELRTPITSILGYTELLAESRDLPAAEREWVSVIARNGTRLSQLVEDLLALGRARAAPIDDSALRTLDAQELIRDVVLTLRPAADAKALTLQLAAGQHDTVRAVPADVLRALGNLVSNAVKFTPAGGAIDIRTERDGAYTVISVADTGPGMTPDALAHAFDRFYRAPDAERDSTPGAGLGLSIAVELAERNGGSITLRSPETGGLTAQLRLPRGE